MWDILANWEFLEKKNPHKTNDYLDTIDLALLKYSYNEKILYLSH